MLQTTNLMVQNGRLGLPERSRPQSEAENQGLQGATRMLEHFQHSADLYARIDNFEAPAYPEKPGKLATFLHPERTAQYDKELSHANVFNGVDRAGEAGHVVSKPVDNHPGVDVEMSFAAGAARGQKDGLLENVTHLHSSSTESRTCAANLGATMAPTSEEWNFSVQGDRQVYSHQTVLKNHPDFQETELLTVDRSTGEATYKLSGNLDQASKDCFPVANPYFGMMWTGTHDLSQLSVAPCLPMDFTGAAFTSGWSASISTPTR